MFYAKGPSHADKWSELAADYRQLAKVRTPWPMWLLAAMYAVFALGMTYKGSYMSAAIYSALGILVLGATFAIRQREKRDRARFLADAAECDSIAADLRIGLWPPAFDQREQRGAKLTGAPE